MVHPVFMILCLSLSIQNRLDTLPILDVTITTTGSGVNGVFATGQGSTLVNPSGMLLKASAGDWGTGGSKGLP